MSVAVSALQFPARTAIMAQSNSSSARRRPRWRSLGGPAVPASAWALQWYEQLPDGPCRRAVDVLRDLRRLAGTSDADALLESFAFAQQHYPEEIVLWTLSGGVVPDPWHNDSVQAGVRSSLLALRQLREAPVAEVPADVPAQDVVPFSGVGHQLS